VSDSDRCYAVMGKGTTHYYCLVLRCEHDRVPHPFQPFQSSASGSVGSLPEFGLSEQAIKVGPAPKLADDSLPLWCLPSLSSSNPRGRETMNEEQGEI
jgi:hypothetical protein